MDRERRFEVFLEPLYERRPVAVTDDESSIIVAHIRKPIGVVPGGRKGLFCNSIYIFDEWKANF